MIDGPLHMWTVYDHPRDYPDVYVARHFKVYAGRVVATTEFYTSPHLFTLREMLAAKGLAVLARNVGDDPYIIETWL